MSVYSQQIAKNPSKIFFLVQMTQNLKIRAYLMQNFMELDLKNKGFKKIYRSQNSDIWGLGPKN